MSTRRSRQPSSKDQGSPAGGRTRRKGRSRDSAPPPTWDERLIQRLLPYQPQFVGGALFLLGALILMGLLGLIGPEHIWLRLLWGPLLQLAGWGALIVAVTLVMGGLYLVLRPLRLPLRFTATQVLGFELMILAALPLTHFIWGITLAEAHEGRGGGLIGWALAQPLLDWLGPLLTSLIYGALFTWGLALLYRFTWNDLLDLLNGASRRLRTWATRLEARTGPAGIRPAGNQSAGIQSAATSAPDDAPARPATASAAPPDSDLIIVGDTAPPSAVTRRRRRAQLPAYDLLREGGLAAMSREEIDLKKQLIEQTLVDFGLAGTVTEIRRGPAVTQFGVTPGYLEKTGPDGQPRQVKVRVNQIASLNRDLALALAVPRLRIEAPVPGRGIVGIEVPNAETAIVRLHTVITAAPFQRLKTPLAVGLGLDVSGSPQATDLARMPHLLIAGTTGSGKSVFINALVTCLIFNNTPEELKLVMIDPKKVELIRFNGLPHLLGQVETEHERIIGVLHWLTGEMDRRYQAFAEVGAKHLDSYNKLITRYKDASRLPRIGVFVDELADLMAMFPVEVERSLCRLAQMARATGIHLVVATQRPSTDVITGLIKANFPARCSFAVASGVDSRVILDTVGAEDLLGRGDMLFLDPDASSPRRIQGCFVADEEIEAVVEHWRQQKEAEDEAAPEAPWERLVARQQVIKQTDDMLEAAIELAQKHDSISASLLQRRLRIGYPRAARLMESLYEMGMVVDPQSGGRTRRSLVNEDDDPLDDYLANQDES